jgi:formate/nitrite transporter FocA (FNT family)
VIASTHETLAQIVLIWLTTGPIGAFGFKHSIAGAVEAFFRVWNGDMGFGRMLVSFEIPALVGNIVGGVVLVALVNHGQVGSKAEKKRGARRAR